MTTDIKELVGRLRTFRHRDANAAADALEAMAGEVDTLQMKLAACGVGALANTERTVAQRITKESPYWSASLGDVYHIVDKEMEARAERDRLKAALDIAKAHAKQNQRARDLVSPYPNDHAKRIVWEKALYHEGKDLWDKLRKALGGDA